MDATGRQLAFIVGHYKSGSTWLANLLSLHPQINGLSETHLFRYTSGADDFAAVNAILFRSVAWSGGGPRKWLRHRLGSLLRPLRRHGQAHLLWNERPTTALDLSLLDQFRLKSLLKRSADPDDYRMRFYSYLYRVLERPGYLLEKTSTNVFFVPEIRRLFPRSKLMVIHRDGRDVVVSDKYHLLNRYGKKQDFSESVLEWRRAIEAERDYCVRHEVYSLSYESLSEDPEGETERILRFLELPHDLSRVQDMVRRSSFRFITGRQTGVENSRAFYRKGVVGDWVNELGPAELEEFSELAGDLLVQLGYEQDSRWTSWS